MSNSQSAQSFFSFPLKEEELIALDFEIEKTSLPTQFPIRTLHMFCRLSGSMLSFRPCDFLLPEIGYCLAR